MNATIEAMAESLNGAKGAMMTGGKFSSNGETLYFRFKARARNNSNLVVMSYDKGQDLFNMAFKRIDKRGLKEIKHYESIYGEDVRGIFESETGLYLSLF